MARLSLLIIFVLCSFLQKNARAAEKVSHCHFLTKNVIKIPSLPGLSIKRKRPDSLKLGHHSHFIKKVIDKIKRRETEWEFIQHPDTVNKLKGKFVLKKGVNVLGWHLPGLGNVSGAYNYSLLSHIAYFSYEVNPHTGSYRTIHGWNNSDLVKKAKAANPSCKVLLTITCFDRDAGIFLNKSKARATLIDSVIALLKRKNGDGVNLDFEDIPRGNQKNMTAFVKEMSLELKKNGMILTMAMPVLGNENLDAGALEPYCDLFVIMAYGFHGDFRGSDPGPNSPLHPSHIWGQRSVSTGIDDYCSQVPSSKILMGVPYYGTIWMTRDCGKPFSSTVGSEAWNSRDLKSRPH